jgi:hypothetical protein
MRAESWGAPSDCKVLCLLHVCEDPRVRARDRSQGLVLGLCLISKNRIFRHVRYINVLFDDA